MNPVDPDRDHFQMFKQLPQFGKVHVLNRVRLKRTSVYAAGTMLTGAEVRAH